MRIRDPLHNLIDFDEGSELERTLLKVLECRQMQRLRRVKQLGFSELVYPGATHSRFAHSLGVFHTARRLIQVVRRLTGGSINQREENVAITAALVHDVGHGPFSHAFEKVSQSLSSAYANHERASEAILRGGEIAEILDDDLGVGFANEVADAVVQKDRASVCNAVVASQFDADRLDYMRRDRLMTGNQNSAIDFEWLLANLEIDEVSVGVDDKGDGTIETFVLGPKAIHAAESYVLGLFQLYPAVYFHKTTRSAEKILTKLLESVAERVRKSPEQAEEMTGLSARHPLRKFVTDPEDLENFIDLDDTVVWGSLSLMEGGGDHVVKDLAKRLKERKLYKCFDIRSAVTGEIDPSNTQSDDSRFSIDRCCESICKSLEGDWQGRAGSGAKHHLLLDQAVRSPYKSPRGQRGPAGQINVKTQGGTLSDIGQHSDVISSLKVYKLARAYYNDENLDTLRFVKETVKREVQKFNS